MPEQREDLDCVRSAFWSARAINDRESIDSAASLWDFLANPSRRLGGWGVDDGVNLFFRGQSDITYGLSNSLYRAVKSAKMSSDRVLEAELLCAERAALDRIRREGLGRNMTDGQLLMVMQHHLMPTRLVDVSRTPFEALYFAVETAEDRDGVVFLINPHDPVVRAEAKLHKESGLPWAQFVRGAKQASNEWTNQVWLIDHLSLDPRMHAQNGVFLVGGLARKYEGVRYRDRRPGAVGYISADVHADICTYSINWLESVTRVPNSRWGASGWVVRVDRTWKRELRHRLKEEKGIWCDSIYPPFDEVGRLVRFVIDSVSKDV